MVKFARFCKARRQEEVAWTSHARVTLDKFQQEEWRLVTDRARQWSDSGLIEKQKASGNLPCCSVMGVGHSETGEGGNGGDEKHFEKYSFQFSAFSWFEDLFLWARREDCAGIKGGRCKEDDQTKLPGWPLPSNSTTIYIALYSGLHNDSSLVTPWGYGFSCQIRCYVITVVIGKPLFEIWCFHMGIAR